MVVVPFTNSLSKVKREKEQIIKNLMDDSFWLYLKEFGLASLLPSSSFDTNKAAT